MKPLLDPFFLAILMMGFINLVSSSPTSDTAVTVDNQKQHCGDRKWIVEHNPCPDKSRHPKFDGQHWVCCDHLTEQDKERTAKERKVVHERHEKATEHGRCMGKAVVGHVPVCTSGEFKSPKFSTGNTWDCCKSLTPEEEKRTESKLGSAKRACHTYGFEHYGFVTKPFSCSPGQYAKKPDPKSSGEDRNDWECCPELTEEEKKTGNQQRKDAKADAAEYREYHAKMNKESGEKSDKERKICNEGPSFCKAVTPTTHRS